MVWMGREYVATDLNWCRIHINTTRNRWFGWNVNNDLIWCRIHKGMFILSQCRISINCTISWWSLLLLDKKLLKTFFYPHEIAESATILRHFVRDR
jgi:hypothetical protein